MSLFFIYSEIALNNHDIGKIFSAAVAIHRRFYTISVVIYIMLSNQ